MHRLALLAALAWTLAGGARADQPFRGAQDQPVDVAHIRLELDIDLRQRAVAGSATIDFTPLRPLHSISLDAVEQEVTSVSRIDASDGEPQPLVFHNTGKKLVIDFPSQLDRGEARQVRIEYRVHDPKSGMYFFQPSEAEPDVPWMAWTQGEPNGNRFWFPSFDHPNERQTTEVIATVERGFEVLSNGRLIERTELEGGNKVRFHWKQEQPHVSYLVTLVVGKFAVVTQEWRGIPVTYYVEPERAADAEWTFGRTLEMLDFFSERFGIQYPWAKYAQVVVEQFVVGGMENTSATTLTERVMHDERAFLDSSPDGLIAHELAHQWWGDLLTCRDWSHLWLNEGFASYCEVLWLEHKLGPEERDYSLFAKSKAARFEAALTRPVVDYHYADPGDMFDSRAYPKGAWLLHMLRKRVGDEDFFRALERYGTAHAYSTVETSDLRRVFERLLGVSLDRFFHDWTARPAHPRLKIGTGYDAEKKLVHLQIQQTQDGEAFEFPLRVELSEADSSAPIVVEQVINEKNLSLYVPVLTRPTLVRVDPEYTLLAEIEEDKPDDWWQAQLTAPTVLERIRAVEHFGKSKKDGDRQRLANVLAADGFYGVQIEAATALGASGGDVSRDALLAGLAHAHPKVRRSCAEALGKFVDDEQALAALRAKQAEGDASYFVEAQVLASLAKVQKRPEIEPFLAALEVDSHNEVIRQAALEALGSSYDPRALDVLVEWTKRGHERSCRIAALGAVAQFLKRNDVTPARQTAALDALLGSLEGESTRVRRAAILALRELGTSAGRPAIALLRSLAQHDPDDRVRSAAADAIKQLVADSPASDELGRLRTEIEDLERRNRELEDRLLQLEAK